MQVPVIIIARNVNEIVLRFPYMEKEEIITEIFYTKIHQYLATVRLWWTLDMEDIKLNFHPNSSISLEAVDDFWDEIFARPIVKYGVTVFTLVTLVCLIPFFWISILFIQNKHFK